MRRNGTPIDVNVWGAELVIDGCACLRADHANALGISKGEGRGPLNSSREKGHRILKTRLEARPRASGL